MKRLGLLLVSLNLLWGIVINIITLGVFLINQYTVLVPIFFTMVLIVSFYIERRGLLRIRKYKDPRVRQVKEIDLVSNSMIFILNLLMFAFIVYIVMFVFQGVYYFIIGFWIVGLYAFIEVGKALAKIKHNRTIIPFD